jgi:hypothetical protein
LESYIDELDKTTFDEYLKGLISKKQSGFRDAKEEFQALKAQFKSFTTNSPPEKTTYDRL